MLPIDLADKVLPPRPGTMLCERLAMPMRRGILFLPFATREYNRCHEAVVVRSSCQFEEGAKVFISASAQLACSFGLGENERTLYVVTPNQVLFTLREFPDEKIEKGSVHHLAGYKSSDLEEFDRAGEKFDEGDPGGLR